MELVVSGSATKEQLWVLEAVLFRSILSSDRPEPFALMWAAVYRARCGMHLEARYFERLYDAVHFEPIGSQVKKATRRGVRQCRVEAVSCYGACESRYRVYPKTEAEAWVRFHHALFTARKRWAYPAKILEDVRSSDHMFPKGAACDDYVKWEVV
jgi:hypothetical protein